MNLFFIPQPQRCICLTGSADIGRETPVVLCMPQPDERLVLAAGKLLNMCARNRGLSRCIRKTALPPSVPYGVRRDTY